VIITGLLLLCVFFTNRVGFATLMEPPRAQFFDFVPTAANGMSWLDWTAAWLTLGLGSLASQDIFQRANAARSETIAVRSTFCGAFLYLLFALLPLYLGLVVLRLEPQLLQGDTQNALLTLVSLHAPLWLQVLFYGALISAIFSTCSGALLAPSSILAENLIKPLLRPAASDRELLWISRGSVLVMAIIATVLALNSGNIYDLVAESSILGAVSILVPMLCALFVPRASAGAALAAMLLGLLAYLWFAYGQTDFPVPAMFMGLLASGFGMVSGLWLTRRQAVV
jgi:Na+/proline symporter